MNPLLLSLLLTPIQLNQLRDAFNSLGLHHLRQTHHPLFNLLNLLTKLHNLLVPTLIMIEMTGSLQPPIVDIQITDVEIGEGSLVSFGVFEFSDVNFRAYIGFGRVS